jgi:hypothetical protein
MSVAIPAAASPEAIRVAMRVMSIFFLVALGVELCVWRPLSRLRVVTSKASPFLCMVGIRRSAYI